LEQLAGLVVEEVQSLWGELMAAPSGEAAEEMVLEWSRKVGRQVLQAGPRARVETVQAQTERACECTGRRHIHSRPPDFWRVTTLLGPVRVLRQYLQCQACGARSFPADEWVGWTDGFSRRLRRS
jgi:DNA-directed RNA polymerase subunit RPC12/RpoP